MHRTVFGTVPVGLGQTISTNVNLFVTFVKLISTGVVISGPTAGISLFSFGNTVTTKAFRAIKIPILLTVLNILFANVLVIGGIEKGVL